jgi:Skp family chaperone for outer membrane proteins
MKLRFLGWIVAAALVTVAATAGFQGGTAKIGVVDLEKVFNDSTYWKEQLDGLKQLKASRQDMIQFVDQYRTFTPEQATKFHDLSIKAPISAVEKAELDKVKKDVMAANERLKNLQTKANPTADESREMQELSRLVQTTVETAQGWSRTASEELDGKYADAQKAAIDKVRDTVKQVAKDGGYTVVFANGLAPYGANDLTLETLKAVNKK